MYDSKLIYTHLNPKSPIAEAYRMLRTNILFSNIEQPLKSFVVTSFSSNEGKTTTIVNLAIIFSQQGSRVLLVDGDLRKPNIHEVFGFENDYGLTNYLFEQKDYRNYIKESQINHLDLLLCGAIPPNPSELLISNVMKTFIQRVTEDYDIVLFDAPPVGMVTDAAIISSIVNGTILVAASGAVSFEALAGVKELLSRVNANIIGVVLNKLDKKSSGYYSNYYYGRSKKDKA